MSSLLLNETTSPGAPAAGKAAQYLDSGDNIMRVIDDTATIRALGQNSLASIVAASSGINTSETIIVGGLNNARIYANQFKIGTVIRATLNGSCTSTAANASTWRFRFGALGTTADGVLGSAANSAAATSGTGIPFEATLVFTVRTIGAAGTIAGYLKLVNTDVTGISAVATQIVHLTPTAIDTTTNNFLSVTYVSAAVTTTSTFQNALIEVVKI